MKISKTRLQDIIKEELNTLAPLFEDDLEEDMLWEDDYIYEEADDEFRTRKTGPVNEDYFEEDMLYEDEGFLTGDPDQYGYGPPDYTQTLDVLTEVGKAIPDIPENKALIEYVDSLILQHQSESGE